MKNIITLFIAMITVVSCSQNHMEGRKRVDEGTIEGNIYTSDDIGWTIQIPKKWDVLSLEEMRALVPNIKDCNLLINFQHDNINSFTSTTVPIMDLDKQSFMKEKRTIDNVIVETYRKAGSAVETAVVTIGGLDFELIRATFYEEASGWDIETDFKKKKSFVQETYNRAFEDFYFSVVIVYNNEKDRNILMEAWKNSKFEKR